MLSLTFPVTHDSMVSPTFSVTHHSMESSTFPVTHNPFLLCYSLIANQKRLEIINEDDVEAYVGLKNLWVLTAWAHFLRDLCSAVVGWVICWLLLTWMPLCVFLQYNCGFWLKVCGLQSISEKQQPAAHVSRAISPLPRTQFVQYFSHSFLFSFFANSKTPS